MSKRIRRNYTTTQKLELLKRHYLDKVPVSDLCDEAQLQPSVFYSWQHRLFENGAVAFESDGPRELLSVLRRLKSKPL